MTEDTRVDWTRQSEENESAEVRLAGQEGASEKHPCAPPKGGGSGFGEGPEMGCGASAQSPPVGVPSPITTSGPRKGAEMGRVASAQTQLGEQTGRGREGEGGREGGRGGRVGGDAGRNTAQPRAQERSRSDGHEGCGRALNSRANAVRQTHRRGDPRGEAGKAL